LNKSNTKTFNKINEKKLSKSLSEKSNPFNSNYNVKTFLHENISKSFKLDLSSDDNKLINNLIQEKQTLYYWWIQRFIDIFSRVKFELVYTKLDSILLHSWLENNIPLTFIVVRCLGLLWIGARHNSKINFEVSVLLPMLEIMSACSSISRPAIVK